MHVRHPALQLSPTAENMISMKYGTGRNDLTLLLLILAAFIFHSPFTQWWSDLNLPWYAVYLLWLSIIVLIAIRHHRSEDP